MPPKKLIAPTLIVSVALAAIYLWIALAAHDEAGQARQQEVVDSVVKAMDDSLRNDRELRQLLLSEQARTDSATAAEATIAAEATADRKVDFLWSVYNEATKKGSEAAMRSVFERHGTERFRRYLKQHSPALPQLLFFPTEDLASTSIWHYQQDWFAVSTPSSGNIVLRVISNNEGKEFRIDDIHQASKPKQDNSEEERVNEDDAYDD